MPSELLIEVIAVGQDLGQVRNRRLLVTSVEVWDFGVIWRFTVTPPPTADTDYLDPWSESFIVDDVGTMYRMSGGGSLVTAGDRVDFDCYHLASPGPPPEARELRLVIQPEVPGDESRVITVP